MLNKKQACGKLPDKGKKPKLSESFWFSVFNFHFICLSCYVSSTSLPSSCLHSSIFSFLPYVALISLSNTKIKAKNKKPKSLPNKLLYYAPSDHWCSSLKTWSSSKLIATTVSHFQTVIPLNTAKPIWIDVYHSTKSCGLRIWHILIYQWHEFLTIQPFDYELTSITSSSKTLALAKFLVTATST